MPWGVYLEGIKNRRKWLLDMTIIQITIHYMPLELMQGITPRGNTFTTLYHHELTSSLKDLL